MNSSNRFISEEWDAEGKEYNLSGLLESLILFDEIIVDSKRLLEIEVLIDCFGLESVIKLLKTGSVKIHNDKAIVAAINNERFMLVDCLKFDVMGFDRDSFFEGTFNSLKNKLSLSKYDTERLKSSLIPIYSSYKKEDLKKAYNLFYEDINPRSELFKSSLKLKVQKKLGVIIDTKRFNIEIKDVDNNLFFYKSNLRNILDVNKTTEHEIILGTLLGIGTIDQALYKMSFHQAITGFKKLEVDVFNTKLKLLYKNLKKEISFDKLHKVIEVEGMPDLKSSLKSGEIDLDKIIEIRNTDEIKDFRKWITGTSDEQELAEYLNNHNKWVYKYFSNGFTKSIRWAVTGGLSFIEPISGTALSAFDNFILEKILKKPGPITFIDDRFKSIYKNK